MGKLVYDIGLNSYYLGIKVASLFNEKASLWLKGRKNWRKKLENELKSLDLSKKTLWFHVSSLGEFEQGRPVMEDLKKTQNINLVLTFFSPSGYEIAKDWEGADVIAYLPLDTQKNASDFIKMVNPNLAVFVKYDFWYHYLSQLKKKNIPSILIAARFYPDQVFFKSWAKWYRKLIFLFDEILVQDQQSEDLLNSIGYKQVVNTGDTRYDRVAELSENTDKFPEIESFIEDKKVSIAGSSWPLDEKIMIDYMVENKHDLRYIIAPHDVSKEHVSSLKIKLKGKAILHSEISERQNESVLIIDSIGMLSRLYKYADIAYVGGAFKEGLHNILEPAAYGKPVITGPDHSGFLEGPAMEKAGALFRVEDDAMFRSVMNTLTGDEKTYKETSKAAKKFIMENRGASKKTIEIIEGY